MKKYFYSLLIICAVFGSCSKYPKKWDARLNGNWVEIDTATNAIKNPTSPNYMFASENSMLIGAYTYPDPSSGHSKLYSNDGQIYEREHVFDFDYEFDGDYLWIVYDEIPTKHPAINVFDSMKFKKQ